MGYVMQYMTHRDGGIFSAEDADSYENTNSKHKKEGAFYVWTKTEIEQVSLLPFVVIYLLIVLPLNNRSWERTLLYFHTTMGFRKMAT